MQLEANQISDDRLALAAHGRSQCRGAVPGGGSGRRAGAEQESHGLAVVGEDSQVQRGQARDRASSVGSGPSYERASGSSEASRWVRGPQCPDKLRVELGMMLAFAAAAATTALGGGQGF
ncbi:MAG: hypothetical protein AAFU61_18260, partial [Pseudomonadota bacterium]